MDDDDDYNEEYQNEEYNAEEYENEEYTFRDPERNVSERVAGRDFFEGNQTLADIAKRNFKLFSTDEERFTAALEIYIRKFKDDFKMTEDDENQLLKNIATINKIKYKNPVCYLFGYFMLGRDNNIELRRLDKVRGLLNSVEDIRLEDVIRYARYWINKKNKVGC